MQEGRTHPHPPVVVLQSPQHPQRNPTGIRWSSRPSFNQKTQPSPSRASVAEGSILRCRIMPHTACTTSLVIPMAPLVLAWCSIAFLPMRPLRMPCRTPRSTPQATSHQTKRKEVLEVLIFLGRLVKVGGIERVNERILESKRGRNRREQWNVNERIEENIAV